MTFAVSESIQLVGVRQSPMEVFLFLPECDSKVPGLVLAQHLPVGHTGIENDEFTLETARRYARAGYAVAVPFLFHWWPKSESMEYKRNAARDDWTVADMQAAFELLASQQTVDARRIGIAGHCWGGRVAWLAACHIPVCAALAIFYGGGIDKGLGEGSVPPLALADRLACPVIGFFGNEDTRPSPQDVDEYARTLQAAGVTHIFHRYDGAGHAFQNFPNPERYHKQASEDAWLRVLDFLKHTLS